MLSMTLIAREARARRAVRKFNLTLRKSRRAIDQGLYAICDPRTKVAVFGLGRNGFEANLDEVEMWLTA